MMLVNINKAESSFRQIITPSLYSILQCLIYSKIRCHANYMEVLFAKKRNVILRKHTPIHKYVFYLIEGNVDLSRCLLHIYQYFCYVKAEQLLLELYCSILNMSLRKRLIIWNIKKYFCHFRGKCQLKFNGIKVWNASLWISWHLNNVFFEFIVNSYIL